MLCRMRLPEALGPNKVQLRTGPRTPLVLHSWLLFWFHTFGCLRGFVLLDDLPGLRGAFFSQSGLFLVSPGWPSGHSQVSVAMPSSLFNWSDASL